MIKDCLYNRGALTANQISHNENKKHEKEQTYLFTKKLARYDHKLAKSQTEKTFLAAEFIHFIINLIVCIRVP